MNATRTPFDNDGSAATPRPHFSDTEYDTHAGWVECSLAGDIYYRIMSTWIASRETAGNVADIYMAGLRYEAALNQFLELSLSAPITAESRLNRAGAAQYKAHLEKEIDYLADKLNAGPEDELVLKEIAPSPPLIQRPMLLPAQIVADVTVGFRAKMAA